MTGYGRLPRPYCLGHEVLSAGSALEAALLMAHYGVPDVAILDIVMPHVTGVQLLEYWRTNPAYEHMPAIFLTARKPEIPPDQAQVRAVVYVVKPVTGAALAAALERALRPARPDPHPRPDGQHLTLEEPV